MLEESRKETAPAPLPASGPELASMMKIGTRVMRGQDWKWGDQVCHDERSEALCCAHVSVTLRATLCLSVSASESGSLRVPLCVPLWSLSVSVRVSGWLRA